ncbi:hypothetical protein [Anaeromyxobacter sp. SG17]|uniref:hypothetical protein n=1 Tax=Anaeromyxobacter sp. SG17 TaxID=2925405 RepID=UPI001F5830E4|nr:hypothetical protein [Anaeromyxobacter sp. SG17]
MGFDRLGPSGRGRLRDRPGGLGRLRGHGHDRLCRPGGHELDPLPGLDGLRGGEEDGGGERQHCGGSVAPGEGSWEQPEPTAWAARREFA